MDNEKKPVTRYPQGSNKMKGNQVSGGVYGLGFIGAAIYFLQHATTVWAGVLGLCKAALWPAVLVYKVLEFLRM